MTDADDKVMMVAIARGLEALQKEMKATREELRALNVLLEQITEKLEANLAEMGRGSADDPDGDDPSGHA